MREALKELDGTRWTFKGTFVRFGRKQYRDHPPQATILMHDVQDATGEVVTDHLWFNLTREFASLGLKPGERVQFDARVKMYRKRNPDAFFDGDEARYLLDYKLSHLTKVKRLTANEVVEDLPLFRELGSSGARDLGKG